MDLGNNPLKIVLVTVNRNVTDVVSLALPPPCLYTAFSLRNNLFGMFFILHHRPLCNRDFFSEEKKISDWCFSSSESLMLLFTDIAGLEYSLA